MPHTHTYLASHCSTKTNQVNIEMVPLLLLSLQLMSHTPTMTAIFFHMNCYFHVCVRISAGTKIVVVLSFFYSQSSFSVLGPVKFIASHKCVPSSLSNLSRFPCVCVCVRVRSMPAIWLVYVDCTVCLKPFFSASILFGRPCHLAHFSVLAKIFFSRFHCLWICINMTCYGTLFCSAGILSTGAADECVCAFACVPLSYSACLCPGKIVNVKAWRWLNG